MHIVGINFISFTAQNNALHMLGKKGDFWHLGGPWPLCPPKSAYGREEERGNVRLLLRDQIL